MEINENLVQTLEVCIDMLSIGCLSKSIGAGMHMLEEHENINMAIQVF